ncbi:MAG: zf-HC2 domain-containing protein [Candidatus Scalindua sp.]
MNCKKVKELILTDYLDGQVNEEQKRQIEKHLASCGPCKEYELLAKKTVIDPFNNAKRIRPSEVVWHKIKEQIEEEQQELASPFADLIRRIKSFLYVPKPAFVVATIMVVLLIIVTIIKLPSEKQEIVKVSPEKQIECMTYLLRVFNQDSTNETNGFGTSIEEYFL